MAASLSERLISFIDENKLFNGVKRLGVAISGGSDSIALLHLLLPLCKERNITIVPLTFDHAIEGENSYNEALFVKKTALSLGLSPIVEKSPQPIRAHNGLSLEMAARNARHDFFCRMAKKENLDAIATGHQKSDETETFLIRLFRGAGATGLTAIKPLSISPNSIKILRPLLPFSREELKDYLRANSIPWMDDISNTNLSIERNCIRLKILPAIADQIQKPLSSLIQSISRTATILRDEDLFLQRLSSDLFRKSLTRTNDGLPALDMTKIRSSDIAISRRALRDFLIEHASPEAAGYDYVEKILKTESGIINLPHGQQLVLDGAIAKMAPISVSPAPPPAPIPLYGKMQWGEYQIETTLATTIVRNQSSINKWPAIATIPLCLIQNATFQVRSRRPGDTISPIGLNGTKKVQDIFVDEKFPRHLRDAYPLITVNDKIAYIPGYRIDKFFKCTSNPPLVQITIIHTRDL